MENLPSGNNSAADRARESVPPGATGFSGQSVVEELRALGLNVPLDEAKAMRIKGRLQIIEGRYGQGYYRRPVGSWSVLPDLDRFFADCYHAVALETVDANTTSETLTETIPGFLSEYFSRRRWRSCAKPIVKDRCSGALLEWQGRLLRMTAERTPTVQDTQGEDTGNEVARRKKLLDEYKHRTHAKDWRIYTGDSGIHKPEFYKWLHGELPRTSATCDNFERFLREGQPPVRRRPKG